jgi:hypothetical protein
MQPFPLLHLPLPGSLCHYLTDSITVQLLHDLLSNCYVTHDPWLREVHMMHRRSNCYEPLRHTVSPFTILSVIATGKRMRISMII